MCKAIVEIKEQGIEQGLEQGIEQGLEQGKVRELVSLVKDGLLQIDIAARRANMTTSEFEKLLNEYNK